MFAAAEEGPEHPDISDALRYLENAPVMLRALQEFISAKQQHEDMLLTRLAAYEERNAQQNMEEGPAPQQPEFNIEEAEWAPLPDSYDAEEQWLAEAELAPLPDDSEESPEVPVALLSVIHM
ncbi:hypothetical protein QQG55_17205 [Brugia pahangi]